MPSKNLVPDALVDPHSLTLDEFLWALGNIQVLRAWANAIETEATRRLLNGEKLPGFKLVEGRANRRWIDIKQALAIFKKLGFAVDDFSPRELVSPAQAEKLFKKTKQMQKFGMISILMERPRGKATIATADDPRTEYVRGSEFEDQPIESEE